MSALSARCSSPSALRLSPRCVAAVGAAAVVAANLLMEKEEQ